MSIVKPLATTLRTLEWEDLPASVRSIPEGFNPLDDGVLMKHQREVAAIQSAIIAVPKGRRSHAGANSVKNMAMPILTGKAKKIAIP